MDLAFGVCVGPSRKFDRFAGPSLRRHCPDAPVLTRRDQTGIANAYNSMIEEACDAAGLVLIHDDVELREDVRPAIRAMLAMSDDVAVVGVIGSRGARFHWPDGEPFGYAEDPGRVYDFGGGTHDVDTVDGLLLALSPWAMKHLRFDSAVGAWHGYDSDICRQARAAGKRVVVTRLDVFHHSRPMADPTAFEQARARFMLKWHGDAAALRRLRWRVESTALGQRLSRRVRAAKVRG